MRKLAAAALFVLSAGSGCALFEEPYATSNLREPRRTSADAGNVAEAGAPDDDDADAAPPPPTDCAGTFEKRVLPALDQAGCAGVSCHGTRLGQAIRIEPSEPALTYKELTKFQLAGKPYVNIKSTDPTASSIHCHLASQCGAKMPPLGDKPLPPTVLAAVDHWLACGAQP